MTNLRIPTLLTILAASACAGSGGSAPASPEPATRPTRVDIGSGQGDIATVHLHTDPNAGTTTLPLPADSVRAALPRAYEVLGVDGTGIEPSTGEYGFRNQRPRRIEGKRLSTFLDCGMGPSGQRADEYQVTVTAVSTVREGPEDSAELTTMVEATARPRAVAGNAITCQSNGTLESRIAELVVWALASNGRR